MRDRTLLVHTSLLLAVALALLGHPSAALAQAAPGDLAQRFAQAWQDRDAGDLARLLAPEGVQLRLDSEAYGGVEPRRVAAALQAYWGSWKSTDVTVSTVHLADREPSKAYGELGWRGVNSVTGEPFEATIFLGFSRSTAGDGGWAVDEVRTIRPR